MNNKHKLQKLVSPVSIAILFGIIVISGVLTILLTNSDPNSSSNNLQEAILDEKTTITTISSKEFREKIESDEYIIIDIRTKEEFEQGHIDGAINIDYYKPQFKDRLSKLDKNKKYLFYCRTGSRSSSTLALFKDLNFNEAYELAGGIRNWVGSGYNLK